MDKEEIIKQEGDEPKVSKEETKAQNKTLRNIFVGLMAFVFVIVIVALSINSVRHFEYNGVEFNVIKEGNLIFYNTIFPIKNPITGKHVADYNIYLRNDPRKLKDVLFEGEVSLKEDVVLNMTRDFTCEGDGVIAVANLVQVLEKFGAKVIKDPEAGCTPNGEYTFIQIREGGETSIESFGPPGISCYNFYVKDCEILEVTEKFMVEFFVEANK